MSPRLAEALALLGQAPAAGEDELTVFSERALASRFGCLVEWRCENLAFLESLVTRFGRETPLDCLRVGDDCELIVESDAGEQHFIFANIDAIPRDSLLAKFLSHLPTRWLGLRLIRFDPSDADHYLILDEATAAQVLKMLGPDAAKVIKSVDQLLGADLG